MLLVLTVVCVGSGALLAWVFRVTEKPIAEAAAQTRIRAISGVLPHYNNDPLADCVTVVPASGGEPMKVYPAKVGEELTGVAVESYSTGGFSGRIEVMVGFDTRGILIDYYVMSHSETPGLGAKMDTWFRSEVASRSVIGRDPGASRFEVSKDGGDIDGITAATITSRAFLDAVRRAHDVVFDDNVLKPLAL